MTNLWNRTRVSETLGIEYPIIQGPLGGLSSQRLAAGVSNFGGLGSFGAHGLQPSAIADVIAEIRSLTTKPFAMNLWVSMEDEGARASDEAAFKKAASRLAPYIAEVGGTLPSFSPYKPLRFEDQARVLLDGKVPVFSFIYGIPPEEILSEARKRRIVTIGTATTVDEAKAIEDAGVDIVVASGFEAGGHRGSFLRHSEDSLTGTISLVPQTVDAVQIPVVAAGGIADELLTVLNEPGPAFLPYPLQRTLMRNLALPAQKGGRADLLALWAGQSANLARTSDMRHLLASLVEEMSARDQS